MDGRKNNGAIKGISRKQGRKPKAKEIELIQTLSPLDKLAFETLKKGLENGEFNFVKLYFEYRFGKPKQFIELEKNQNQPKQVFKIGDQIIEF
jgi:hypothetical protein